MWTVSGSSCVDVNVTSPCPFPWVAVPAPPLNSLSMISLCMYECANKVNGSTPHAPSLPCHVMHPWLPKWPSQAGATLTLPVLHRLSSVLRSHPRVKSHLCGEFSSATGHWLGFVEKHTCHSALQEKGVCGVAANVADSRLQSGLAWRMFAWREPDRVHRNDNRRGPSKRFTRSLPTDGQNTSNMEGSQK